MSKRSGGVAAAESAAGAFCEWRGELFRNPQKPPQARFANGAVNCFVTPQKLPQARFANGAANCTISHSAYFFSHTFG